MIKDIKIKNFRGLQDLEIQDFERFNIFVGENSCGKTSILEAIFVCYGAEEAIDLIKIQNSRQTTILPTNITSIFYNFDFLKPIEFYSNNDFGKIEVEVLPKAEGDIFSQKEFSYASMLEQKIHGLKLTKKMADVVSISHFKVLLDGKIEDVTRDNTPSPVLAIFLSSDIEKWGLKYFIDIVRKEKKRDELVKYLKLFDERVSDIEVQENSVLINLEGISKLININFLGEGFKKYTTIIALMLVANQWHTHFCICIDEIENGLHFSSIQKLLTSIFRLSEQIDFQFFFTTHSLEFLDISRKILGKKSKVFKVASTKEGIKTYPYSQDGESYFTLDRIDPRGGQ